MRRIALSLSLVLVLAALTDAFAISATCLPGGFPTTPGPQAVGRNVTWGLGSSQDEYRIDVWRVACQDGSGAALLLRATPITSAPFVCSSNFTLIQGGQQIDAVIRQSPSDFSFRGDLLVATTFALERQSGPAFSPTGAFTLDIDQLATHTTLEVPAGGGAPQLGITVVSTGCNPCRFGQTATFHVHAINPGGTLDVELRAGIRFPNNGPLVPILDLCTETVLPTGEQNIPLTSIVVPGDVPNGTYTIEAAILDPVFGATLSRHSVNVAKQ